MSAPNRFLEFFRKLVRRNADRRDYLPAFIEHLNGQAFALHIPGAVICGFAWLGFAFVTDRQLHPDFRELIYFRLALTGLALLLGVVVVVDALIARFAGADFKFRLRGKGFFWLYLLSFYTVAATSYFTGRIAHDANYVSGLQLIILVITVVPMRLRYLYLLYFVSIIIFSASVLYHGPDLGNPGAEYSMQNLFISYAVGFILGFMLDRFRFNGFVNHTRVIEQGREVEARMEQIRELKIQQDGDYFLTARLLEPLIRNDARGEAVRVDFLLNQKKKFTFRKWTSEIGGDFLAAHTIKLREREFTAFVNGDAMGKSIQGAGGALVLGTVFKSVISRTEASSAEAGKYPERWLKDCFVELQNTFVSFDGTMMISAVLGLLETSTGVMYYINAEHPWIVLYRGGGARFIEKELVLRKLGIGNLESHLRVELFQLEPGDAIIVGSDGRDDVVLGLDAEGGRIINEDERKFLEHVDQAGGDLKQIEKSIVAGAELADDLSLLRLGYREGETNDDPVSDEYRALTSDAKQDLERGDAAAAREKLERAHGLRPHDPGPPRKLARLLAAQGLYHRAALYCERYTELNPMDTDYIFITARMYKKAYAAERDQALLAKAADFGERGRLRDGGRSENLINLADVYRLMGNRERAGMILDLAERADPHNQRVSKLRSLLNR